MQTIVIRADASSTIGTGHLMRMIALAQAHQRRGGNTIFATAACPQPLADRLVSAGFEHHSLEQVEPGSSRDAQLTKEICRESNATWLVIDGYHFEKDFSEGLATPDFKILSLTDSDQGTQVQPNAILNQNLGAEKFTFPPEIETLLGTRYALLRQDFLDHPKPPPKDGPVKNLLITFGGSDPINATSWALQALDSLDLSAIKVRAIIGPANPHRDELLALSLSYPVEFKTAVTDMPAEYAWADSIISAGGSSCWEWLYFGLRGAVATIADNQEPITTELREQRLALSLGWPGENDAPSLLSIWLKSPADSLDLPKIAALIDGRGADRVISHLDLSRCLIRNTHPLLDARFTFDLVNQPSVRNAGYSTDPIPWDNHLAWLERHCTSPESHLFVGETLEGEQIGLLRFHLTGSAWEIGIALTPDSRGRGFADHLVTLGMRELASRHQISHFIATIKPQNSASKNLFTRLGFTHQSTEGDREHWTYHLS